MTDVVILEQDALIAEDLRGIVAKARPEWQSAVADEPAVIVSLLSESDRPPMLLILRPAEHMDIGALLKKASCLALPTILIADHVDAGQAQAVIRLQEPFTTASVAEAIAAALA